MEHQHGSAQLGQASEAGLSHVAFDIQMYIGVLKAVSPQFPPNKQSLTLQWLDHSQENNKFSYTKLALSSLSVGDVSIVTPGDGGPVILSPPLSHTASKDYVGANVKDLVVRAGEEVIVFAWADQEKVAIAYNPKCDKVGMIPKTLLERNPDAAQNDKRCSIQLIRRANIPQETKPKNAADNCLTLDRGHYILAYNVNHNT